MCILIDCLEEGGIRLGLTKENRCGVMEGSLARDVGMRKSCAII